MEGPIGPWRDDFRAGISASVIANVNRDPKKKVKPYSPVDFVPDWDADKPTQTPAQQQSVMQRIAAAMRTRG